MMNPNEVIPPEMLTRNASNDMLLFTSMISLMVAAALIYIGKIGKQLWLIFWGAGLIVMSIYMATTILLGFDPILG
jgi:hypothetical protein